MITVLIVIVTFTGKPLSDVYICQESDVCENFGINDCNNEFEYGLSIVGPTA